MPQIRTNRTIVPLPTPRGGVYRSSNSGGSWSLFHTGLSGLALSVHALAIDPTTAGTLYAATEAGVYSIQPVAVCVGDCDASGSVVISELVTLVNIALGITSVAECGSGDANGDGEIGIDEIIRAVTSALSGCRVPAACGGIAGLPCVRRCPAGIRPGHCVRHAQTGNAPAGRAT